jgi:hypothetical protein
MPRIMRDVAKSALAATVSLGVGAAVLVAAARPAVSQNIIPAADGGWYDETGFHDPMNTNFLCGLASVQGAGDEFRNFFVFDLSASTPRCRVAVLGAPEAPASSRFAGVMR